MTNPLGQDSNNQIAVDIFRPKKIKSMMTQSAWPVFSRCTPNFLGTRLLCRAEGKDQGLSPHIQLCYYASISSQGYSIMGGCRRDCARHTRAYDTHHGVRYVTIVTLVLHYIAPESTSIARPSLRGRLL